MSLEYNFRFPLPNGLHARPASYLAEQAARFSADVTFVNLRTGARANLRSVLALVSSDTRTGDLCRLLAVGADADLALSALRGYIEGEFGGSDAPLPPVAEQAGEVLVPHSLRAVGLGRHFPGRVACAGIGEGRMVRIRSRALQTVDDIPSRGMEVERATLARAIELVRADYQRCAALAEGAAAGILRAHLGLLNDPGLADGFARLLSQGASASRTVSAVIGNYIDSLQRAETAYLRERVLDLEDIAEQLLEKIAGPSREHSACPLEAPSIVVATRLSPRELLALDRRNLRGLVLGQAGQTSHTVILARSFDIPTLTGVVLAGIDSTPGATAIVDAQDGLFVPDPTPGVSEYYRREKAKLDRERERLALAVQQLATTADGRRLEVGANIVAGEEAAGAFAHGAEGIGLFRTELLFADREAPPSEEEQYAAYVAAVKAARGRPVIIRTLDIGGDKPVRFLPQPAENNPFLGHRGVRLYREQAALLTTQFRAIWRAAQHGPVKVLVPMISCVEEARETKRRFLVVREELIHMGVAVGEAAFGLMLEVPATAFILRELCAVADFFSLGTNDLTQYFMAADRENEKVAALYSPFFPAFLRLLRQMVDDVHAAGSWIGLCGEMAENAVALPLLVGLGLDEISVAPARVPAIKRRLSQLQSADCMKLLQLALAAATREEVERILQTGPHAAAPLLSPDLVLSDVEADSKEEVIRLLVNSLQLAERTRHPTRLEEAIWRRESTYSTGFGDGFALPHCKSDDVSDNSIAIARLKRPVAWGSLDGNPVDVVILLVIRAGDHGRLHLQSLSRLSRLVTSATFREQVRTAPDSPALIEMIRAQFEAGVAVAATAAR